ncbi:hypothetical protein [Haloferax sulfurifontis]|uniref:Uncharacterized protein n=1 Tax=Haloferax sulfurifontis TaxID=255616 RepID=A0A830E7Z4_9EURY|nr:hypothetical protein [Haloferax sulfurifontis]GGC63430.1 hypothetical protein GCM10007209_26960 [Haloferax sulfurifontis]
MPPKAHRLINYEKEYAETGEAPKESSYRDHELRARVQEKADLIGPRIDSLWEDITSIALLDDVAIRGHHSPRSLGTTFGSIASTLYQDDGVAGAEWASNFLAGVVEGLDTRAPHDSVTKDAAKEETSALLSRVESKSMERIESEAKESDEFFEATYVKKEQDRREAKQYIGGVLSSHDIDHSQHHITSIQFELTDSPVGYPMSNRDFSPADSISEDEILTYAAENRIEQTDKLWKAIGQDLDRLRREWRGQSIREVFEQVASHSREKAAHTDTIVKEFSSTDPVIAILKDLSGRTGRRKDESL